MADKEQLEDKSDSEKQRVFRNSEHSGTVQQALLTAWKNKQYCDITLKIGQDSVQTHRLVLSSLSEYFKVLLHMDIDGKSDEAEIHEVEFSALLQILEYAYTGSIEISVENVSSLFVASNYLQVTFVQESCEQFLMQNIDKTNCIGIWRLAYQYSSKKVVLKAMQVVASEFDYIIKTEEFPTLVVGMLLDFLQEKGLVISRERTILPGSEQEVCLLSGVLHYIDKSGCTTEDAVSLLKAIRLPLIEDALLTEHFSTYPELYKQDAIQCLLDSVRQVKSLNISSKEVADQAGVCTTAQDHRMWMTPRKPKVKGYLYNERKYGEGGRPGVHFFLQGSYGQPTPDKEAWITAVKVFVRFWSEYEEKDPIIGGMKLTYSDGTVMKSGLPSDSHSCKEVHSFDLEDSEYITKIIFTSGWMVDSVTFYTNFGKIHGPWGGTGGGERICTPPNNAVGFLHGFAGLNIISGGSLAIHRVRVGWATVEDLGNEIPDLHEGLDLEAGVVSPFYDSPAEDSEYSAMSDGDYEHSEPSEEEDNDSEVD